MALELKCSFFKLLELKSGVGAKGDWSVQPFVVETEGQYPKKVLFEAWNDVAKQVQAITVGNRLIVSFEPEASEYNGKWFGKLKAWKIVNESGQNFSHISQQAVSQQAVSQQAVSQQAVNNEFPNDLPF